MALLNYISIHLCRIKQRKKKNNASGFEPRSSQPHSHVSKKLAFQESPKILTDWFDDFRCERIFRHQIFFRNFFFRTRLIRFPLESSLGPSVLHRLWSPTTLSQISAQMGTKKFIKKAMLCLFKNNPGQGGAQPGFLGFSLFLLLAQRLRTLVNCAPR